MLMVIVGGGGLLGIFLLFGKLWGGDPAALAVAAKLFVPVWLAISVANRGSASIMLATPSTRNCRFYW